MEQKNQLISQVVALGEPSTAKIWHMTAVARVARQLAKLGVAAAADMTSTPPDTAGTPGTNILLFRADRVFDGAIWQGLLRRQNCLLLDRDGLPVAAIVAADHPACAALAAAITHTGAPAAQPLPGIDYATIDAIADQYDLMLRKRMVMHCDRLDQASQRQIERRLFDASYKGVTDLVTKYWWPTPAFHATRFCARWGVSPNMVTTIGFIFVLLASWCFIEGYFLTGLLAGWAMTFLDTVDGKLARVTLTSSKWGNIFDHGIDLIHPPFWYWAWAVGLAKLAPDTPPLQVAGLSLSLGNGVIIIFASYILGRVVEGYFMRRFGFHIHVWRPWDSWFRLIVARRNPNLIMLSLAAVAQLPGWGFWAVVIWTFLSVPVHLVQSLQAEWQRCSSKKPLTSWLDQQAG